MAQIAEKKRLNYIDDAKALAIFLMILGHLPIGDTLATLIYGFHMPLFFIISGMFFNPDRSLYDHMKKGFKQLMIPYLCFEFINLSICWISPYMHPELYYGMSGLNVFKAAVLGIFLGQDYVSSISFLPSGPLWFLVALFNMRVIFAVLCKLFRNKYLLTIVATVLGIGLFFCLSKNVLPFSSSGTNVFSIRCAAMGLPFYAFGYCMQGIDFTQIKYRPLIVVTLMVLYFISALYNGDCGIDELNYGKSIILYYLNAIIGSIAVILFFSMMILPMYVHNVGRNTLLVLGLHTFPMVVCKAVVILVLGQSYLSNWYIYLPVSILCIVAVLPLQKFFNKYLPFVLGK